MLSKHRIYPNREWFDISKETAIEVINLAQLILDQAIPYSENLTKHNVHDRVKAILDEACEDKAPPAPVVEAPFENKYDIQNKALQGIKDAVVINAPPPTKVNNPKNYAAFIQECCELDPEYFCIKADIHGAHKLWARSQEANLKASLFKYLEGKFTSAKRYYADVNATLAIYHGIRPKAMFLPAAVDEITQFINDRCKVGHIYRISNKAICAEFEDWKRQQGLQEYSLDKESKAKLMSYLNLHYFPCTVHLSVSNLPDMKHNNNSHGVWGITLKNDNANTGIKLAHSLKKTVVAVNVKTNEIKHRFDSLSDAARFLEVGPSMISNDIKWGRVRSGLYLRYIDKDGNMIVPRGHNPVQNDDDP